MFSISKYTKNGFDIVELKDTTNGTSAEIIPNCGAILHSFNIEVNNKKHNIIDGYADKAAFTNHVAAQGFKSCKLSPFVCRIKNGQYQFDGKTYTIEKYYLGPNAIHGLIYDAPFSIIHQQADHLAASVSVEYNYNGDDKGYPFVYTCQITYTLSANNQLQIATSITNNNSVAIPLQDGWHPYFTLAESIDELYLKFDAAYQYVFDENMIPTGATIPFDTYAQPTAIAAAKHDDCFKLAASPTKPIISLTNKKEGVRLNIIPDESYPYLQIYTPPHRHSIAIENLSSPPDGFNNGIDVIMLPPNEVKHFVTNYQIVSL
jgi:aldose 1-epimerase